MLSLRIDKRLSELSYKFANIKPLNGTLLWANPNLRTPLSLNGAHSKEKEKLKNDKTSSSPNLSFRYSSADLIPMAFFFFATDAPGKEARTLFSGKPLQPLILSGKATSLP